MAQGWPRHALAQLPHARGGRMLSGQLGLGPMSTMKQESFFRSFLFVNCTMLPRLAASLTDAVHSDEPHPALDVDDVHLWLQPPASNSMGGPGLRTAQGTAAAQKANCDALGTQPAL